MKKKVAIIILLIPLSYFVIVSSQTLTNKQTERNAHTRTQTHRDIKTPTHLDPILPFSIVLVPALVNKPDTYFQKVTSLVHYMYQFSSEKIFDSAEKSKRRRQNLKAVIISARFPENSNVREKDLIILTYFAYTGK